jgi:aspartate-semialdehyde dehydrogenase
MPSVPLETAFALTHTHHMKKLRCALLGATGLAGQQFITELTSHPYFEITGLFASPRNANKKYVEALKTSSGMVQWFQREPIPKRIQDMTIQAARELKVSDFDVVFSAVESEVAQEFEPLFAKSLPVISAASAFRYENDVPLVIPSINAEHIELIRTQQKNRNWNGFIAPVPNCTTTGLAVTLKPLQDAFGLNAVVMTSMQAVSGAGRSPGVAALDVIDNVIPHIPKEEWKVEVETKKILSDSNIKISCTCTRVAVLEGHTEAVWVSLKKKASIEELSRVMRAFKGHSFTQNLPNSPPEWIVVRDDSFRPQPRLDRDTHNGMATTVGRIREDTVFENGFKYVLVSHNTKAGAATGAILLAELLKSRGFISGV